MQIEVKGDFGEWLVGPYLHMLDLLAALNLEKKITIGDRCCRVGPRHHADPHLHRLVNGINLNRLQIKVDTGIAAGRTQFTFARLLRQIKLAQNDAIGGCACNQQRCQR